MSKVRLTVWIPKSLMVDIRSAAKATEKNLSEFAREVFEEWFKVPDGFKDELERAKEAAKERKIRNLRTSGRKP